MSDIPFTSQFKGLHPQASIIAWSLTTIVSLLAVYVWGASLSWHFSGLSIYQLFPVLGLVAWSVMWSHYMSGFINDKFLGKTDLRDYKRLTGYAVLLLILLHPGLLIYQRFRDGYGLPPKSYETYVAPGLGWITLLGTVSLLAFLAYELHRFYRDRSWWKYVLYANEVAMLAIFYHGLRLGTQLHVAWFRYVWLFYGICLVIVLLITHVDKLQHSTPAVRH